MADQNVGDVMDVEVIPLCESLNRLTGIETISSCCGHGYAPFRIYFIAEAIQSLRPILGLIDESEIWKMRVSMASGDMQIYFVLEGQTGEKAFAAADDLATKLTALADQSQVEAEEG